MTLKISVFLKYPEPGRVKTRLAATVGNERAAQLYEEMVAKVFGTLRSLEGDPRFEVVLLCDPMRPIGDYEERFPSKWAYVAQRGEGLGQRLDSYFRESGGWCAAIGTDCVEIRPEHFARTHQLLAERDVVVGPASDGGYYLIATNRHLPTLFQGISWSTASVLPQTLQRAAEGRFRVELLEELHDIDVEADLS